MELGIGIVGAGNFGRFTAQTFQRVPGIRIVGVMDNNEVAVQQMASQLDAYAYSDYESFLANMRIALVYIATPPFLHYQQSKLALLAGKHVICEKPAALQSFHAEELSALARSLGLLYVVNLMQRYNPLYRIVKTIIVENILGGFLHGYFENYASDENLPADHWFWEETKSGGIFIEHGVHFFDMFSGWLGEGKVVSALQLQRPGVAGRMVDRVQASALFGNGLVNFYHGFNQPKVLDRQEMRLQFEWGEITLFGWVPLKMKFHGLLQDGFLRRLQEIIGVYSLVHHSQEAEPVQKMEGRYSRLAFEDHITMEYENVLGKQEAYQEMLMAMINDQWNWIRDPGHIRMIDDRNAVQSLKMAQDAARMAKKY
jgi:predicted dehydrogenase